MGFLFGGNTGVESPDELQRRRAIVDALIADSTAGIPNTLGEGIATFGKALAGRIKDKKLGKQEDAERARIGGKYDSIVGGLMGPAPAGGSGYGAGGGGGSSRAKADPLDPRNIAGDTMAALGKDSGTAGYRASLIGTESGGNWGAQNNEIGAGGKAGHYGRVQFGRARLQEAMDAGAIPQGTTPEQFMQYPALQIAAENWHFGDLESKLGDLVGTEVNGQPLDMGALVAMGHLGGAGGARKYVESGGRYNPSDSFGTSLAEYASTHGGQMGAQPAPQGGDITMSAAGGDDPMAGQQPMPAQAGPDLAKASQLAELLSNPYLDDGKRKIAEVLLAETMQPPDPMAALELEKAQLEVDAMKNPPASKPTGDIAEYEYARQQGYEGTFTQFKADMKKAGASNTTVTVGGAEGTDPAEAALRKTLGETQGKQWAEYANAGVVSAGTAQDMALLDQLIPMVPSGPIQGRLAETFPGFSSAGDAFQSIVKRVAPTLRAPGSGATSDIEYDGMLKSLPALRNSPEANQAIGGMMKAKAALNIERAGIIAEFQNGRMSITDARDAMAELDKRSIMTPELQALFAGLGGGGATPAPAQTGPITTDDGYVIEEVK